jgi:hypothetical protein
MKYAKPSFFHGYYWIPRRRVKSIPVCIVPLILLFYLIIVLRLAHLESHHQCGKTTDDCQDAENKRQGQGSNKGVKE